MATPRRDAPAGHKFGRGILVPEQVTGELRTQTEVIEDRKAGKHKPKEKRLKFRPIHNGFPVKPYLPRDPVARANLLAALGITEDQLINLED